MSVDKDDCEHKWIKVTDPKSGYLAQPEVIEICARCNERKDSVVERITNKHLGPIESGR